MLHTQTNISFPSHATRRDCGRPQLHILYLFVDLHARYCSHGSDPGSRQKPADAHGRIPDPRGEHDSVDEAAMMLTTNRRRPIDLQVRSVTVTAQQQITRPAAARSLVLTKLGIRTHRRILSHGRSLKASYMASCDCCRTARHEPRLPLDSVLEAHTYSRVAVLPTAATSQVVPRNPPVLLPCASPAAEQGTRSGTLRSRRCPAMCERPMPVAYAPAAVGDLQLEPLEIACGCCRSREPPGHTPPIQGSPTADRPG